MKRLVALLAIMLLSFGLTNAANKVFLTKSGVDDTVRIGTGFTFDVAIENSDQWNGMSLGFQISSPDGATWSWTNMGAAGFGTSKAVTVVPGCRMTPTTSVWDFGFLITEQHLATGPTPDSILLGGVANAGGLPVGASQPMMQLNLMVSGGANDGKHLCIDSAKIGDAGDWVYANTSGGSFPPEIGWVSGQLCFPIAPTRNIPPSFTNCPASAINLHHCVTGTFQLTAVDPTPDPYTFSLVSATGGGSATVTGAGLVTYVPVPADAGNTISIVVAVKDAFVSDAGAAHCTVQFAYDNQVPTINCGAAYAAIAKGNLFTKTDITGNDADPCDTKIFSLGVGYPAAMTINPATGAISWLTTPADIGVHTVQVCVTDGIVAAPVCCTFQVEVLATEPFGIRIDKAHNVLQGHYYDLHITQTLGTLVMGGFDFLVSYDASALTFSQATPGAMLTQCGWEYFTYRFGPDGNCGNGCPSGMIRIVAMAETNNGPHHPVPNCKGTDLVVLTFLVSNNRTLDCQFVPIRFFWYDCGDNTVSTPAGDSLLISRFVYDYVGSGGADTYTEITNNAYGFPGWFGAPEVCMNGDKVKPIRFIDFYNGGIDIVCADSIDARGDINANGVKDEIADAVMFTNYFITGLSAFGSHVESSIAASDVNADGISLSVADLVYLIRVIVGDAHPYAKPLPGANVTFSAQGNVVTYTAGTELGAAWLVFNVKSAGAPVLGDGAANMNVLYSLNGSTLKVLVYNIGSNAIASGSHTLMTVPGEGLELVSVETADFNGNALNASVKNLPTSFMLAQNAPNPFNPTTKIAFTMPVSSEYTIAIYNVAGQLVKSFNGHSEAGTVEVIWDGTDTNHTTVASGIYFYKASANNFSATKKMVLMK